MITDREKFLMFEAVCYYRQKRLSFIEYLDTWLHETIADCGILVEDGLGQAADHYAEGQKAKKEQLEKEYPYKIKPID